MDIVGKYICTGRSDGGFCIGRVTGVIQVNTVDGLMDAVIVEDRVQRSADRRVVALDRPTILRLDQIDPKKDIFDESGQNFKAMSDNDLFLLSLGSDDVASKIDHLGFSNMAKAGIIDCIADRATREMKRRIKEREEQNERAEESSDS